MGERAQSLRGRAAALLLATFAAGAITGYSVAYGRQRATPESAHGSIRVMLADSLPPAFQQLRLTAEQRIKVIEILARARPKTDSALRAVLPRLRALTDSVDADIRAILRPDQRAVLSTMRGASQPVLLLKRGSTGEQPARIDTLAPREQ